MAPGFYETWAASIDRMRGGHFMVVCCRDVSRPGCATAPVLICGDVAPDRSARTRFDHHQPPGIFPAINIPVVNVISTTISRGRFQGRIPMGRCALFGNRDANRIGTRHDARPKLTLPKQDPLGETACIKRQSFKHRRLLSRLV